MTSVLVDIAAAPNYHESSGIEQYTLSYSCRGHMSEMHFIG